jgi:hypothetical protein
MGQKYSDCFFGLATTSAAPCFHFICGAYKQKNYRVSARTRKLKEKEKDGRDGRDPTPKNMDALMPAKKSLF